MTEGDEWADPDELFNGGGGGALDLTALQPIIDVLTKPENMGNIEALLRESYKFIRLADDLHDIKSYLNDMRICFIALTVSGYVGIIAYALILICKRRRRQAPANGNHVPPAYGQSPYPYNSRQKKESTTDWPEAEMQQSDETSPALGSGRRMANAHPIAPQLRHEPGYRRDRGVGLGSRPHLKAQLTQDHHMEDSVKSRLEKQTTLSSDRQTSPGLDAYSHVVPALVKDSANSAHHGHPDKGENV